MQKYRITRISILENLEYFQRSTTPKMHPDPPTPSLP